MKKLNLGKKEYMLFGIPDKVIIENGDIEILDYKYSELRDPKKNQRLSISNFILSLSIIRLWESKKWSHNKYQNITRSHNF